MKSPEISPEPHPGLLRTATMGVAVVLIIGGLSLLALDLYASLAEQTDTAQKNLQQAFADTQRQTFVYSSMLANNPLIQRGAHFKLTGSLLNQIVPTLNQSKVDRITIHSPKGSIMAQAHEPGEINLQENHAHLVSAQKGISLSTIYEDRGQWRLETTHPIFHQLEEQLLVGTVSVGYILNDRFTRQLEKQVGHPILLTHQQSILGTSLQTSPPQQWNPSQTSFSHSETNYDVVQVPLTNTEQQSIHAIILVNTLSQRLTLIWLALSIPALIFVWFRERSVALQKEKYKARENSFIQERKAAEKVQAEVKRRRQAQKDLEVALEKVTEASRLKSEFLATVSHELRTPLNAIMNIPRGLLKDYEEMDCWSCASCDAVFQDPSGELNPNEEQPCPECNAPLAFSIQTICSADFSEHKSFLERIARSGSHLLRLIDDVLDMSKLEAGAARLNTSTFSLDQLFREISELTSKLAEEKSQKIIYPGPIANQKVHADYVKLVQILVNLIGNAIKFTPDSGRIEVEVIRNETPHELVFKVVDSGEGIPQDNLKTIFESFRQVDGSATRTHQGSGLGLSISRGLVELHGGTIFAQSEVGQGSTFEFNIPQSSS